MEPLKDWYRYLDQVSRPVRKDTEPEAPQEESPWRPWKQGGFRQDGEGGQPVAGTLSPDITQEASERELPGSVVPPPLFPNLSGSVVRLGTCMPAGRHYEDLTVNDTLQPIPEFSVPQLRPPALELVVPALPSRPGNEGANSSTGPLGAAAATSSASRAPLPSVPASPSESSDRKLPEQLGNLLQEVVEAAVEARLREPHDLPGSASEAAASRHIERGAAEAMEAETVSPEEDAGRTDRAPRHWDLLTQIRSRDVAQNSYKSPFQETREELVQRLLDPELTLEETARLLDVCPTTVRRYTNKGLLRCFRTPGNQRRFRLSDVFEFMENRFVDSGGDSVDDEVGDDERN